MSLRTPLSRVLGLGTAKEGVGHWWMQRVSAVALVLLTLWFIVSLLSLGGALQYEVMRDWIARPANTALLVLLVIALMYHSQLGVQVVIEDYVPHRPTKLVSLIANQFVHLALGAIAVFAVLRTAFGGVA